MKKVFSAILIFLFLPMASAQRLSELGKIKGAPEKTAEKKEKVPLPTPVISSILIDEKKEKNHAIVAIHGKNLADPMAATSVFFPGENGAPKIGTIRHFSKELLTVEVPDGVGSGAVIVKLSPTSIAYSASESAPFFFEFQTPKILFATADDGFAPGKKIKIWGENFDGVSFRARGKSKIDFSRLSGKLRGAEKSAGGNLSVIETVLPPENFFKEFWIERNCDANGENCLESNKISFSSAVPPILNSVVFDNFSRTIRVSGENFPDIDADKVSVTLDNTNISVKKYDAKKNFFIANLPCPLPPFGNVKMKVAVANTTVESNPVRFLPTDAPQIFNLSVESADKPGKSNLLVSTDLNLHLSPTIKCGGEQNDRILRISGKSFPLSPAKGGLIAKNVPSNQISSGPATLILNGVSSPEFPFVRKKEFGPVIFRVASKFGFHPGATFTIFGVHLGNQYLACGKGETRINGVPVYAEERIRGKNGGTFCHPIRPKVSPNSITAQFVGLKSGESYLEKGVTTKKISVSVGSATSNEIEIPFNDSETKIVDAAPKITKIVYPEGHNPGDKIEIWGGDFGEGVGASTVFFENQKTTPLKVSPRKIIAKIPENIAGKIQNIFISRGGKVKKDSENFPFLLAGGPKKLEFDFLPIDKKKSSKVFLDVSKEPQTFPAAKFSVQNFYGDLKIRKLKIKIKYRDGDPDSPTSVEKTRAFPFGIFTLKRNQKKLAEAIATKTGDETGEIVFLHFDLPLTTKDFDTLTLDGEIFRTATDGSDFSFSFSPEIPGNIVAFSPELKKGVIPKNQKTLLAPEHFFVKNTPARCLDTDPKNIHCDEFFKKTPPKKSKNIFQKSPAKTPEKSPKKVAKKHFLKTIFPLSKKSPEKKSPAKKSPENPPQILAKILRENFRDADRDGLSDGIETLLKTDPKKSDTDGDGYPDFLEMEFGYDPTQKISQKYFSDAAGKFGGDIFKMARIGAVDGFSDGTFRPRSPATRGFFLRALSTLFAPKTTATKSQFSDISRENPFFDAVVAAEAANFFDKNLEPEFRPFENISRGDACVLTLRAAGFSLVADHEKKSRFLDVRGAANPFFEKCADLGLFPPTAEKFFSPNQKVSRGEAAAAILRATRFFRK